jgi:outer membrane protein TolC
MQSDLTKVKNMPKLSAFATGGYGKPGLNFLKNEFRPYAIVGVAAKWNLTDKINRKESNDKELLAIQSRTIELQKEAFLLNADLQTQQLLSEIEKYKQLIVSDQQIIDLRQKNKVTSSTQLDNGIITANDFVIEANAENQARQNLVLHELQLLMSEILLKTVLGN